MKVGYLPHFADNPYQTLLCREAARLGVEMRPFNGVLFIWQLLRMRPTLLHVHWLHPFYIAKTRLRSWIVLALFLAQWSILRMSRVTVVWTVHNLRDHEGRMPNAEILVTRLVSLAARRIIVHCETAKKRLLATYPWISDECVVIVPHGSYVGIYPETCTRESARKCLEVPMDQKVLLFFGELRAYKGVLELTDSFIKLGNSADVLLLIVGRPHTQALAAELRRRSHDFHAIRLHLGYIPDNEIQTYMRAADCVVVPFRDVLTSGSLILALSFGKTVIAPRVGCAADLEGAIDGYFYDPVDPSGLYSALDRFAREAREVFDTHPSGLRNRAYAQSQTWSSVARLTKRVYEEALKTA